MILKVKPLKAGETVPAPLDIYRCSVVAEWVDYNNHMTEAAYLTAFGWASDVLFQYIGINDDYRARGNSYYTVETHIIYEREADLDDKLRITTQVLDFDAKRLHFNHEMFTLQPTLAWRHANKCLFMSTRRRLNRHRSPIL